MQIDTLQFYLSPTNRTYGVNDLSICQINKTHIHVDLNPYYSDHSSTNLTLAEQNKCYVGEKLDAITMNPNSIAYDDNELRYGFESTFLILVWVSTFYPSPTCLSVLIKSFKYKKTIILQIVINYHIKQFLFEKKYMSNLYFQPKRFPIAYF